VAGGENTHDPSYGGSGRHRGGGSRSRDGWVISWAEVPGSRRQTDSQDRRMIRKPGIEVESEIRQIATGIVAI